MHRGLSFAGLAAILMLATAPASLAQNQPAQPTAPPAAQPAPSPTPPATPATPATPSTPGSPATPAAPATPNPDGQGPADPARTCSTFRDVGQACSCLSAPTEMGTSEAPTNGGPRNVCVVPRA